MPPPESAVLLLAVDPVSISVPPSVLIPPDCYWKFKGAEQEIAWSYSNPFHQVSAIAGLIAFYNERVEITVDGLPQTWAERRASQDATR
jgi:hypothetical protein